MLTKNRKSETSLVSLASFSCSKYYFSVFISLTFCTLLNFFIFYHYNQSAPSFVHNKEVSYTNFDDEIKPIAIVFPQYHSVPENDQFWGKDFTEWTFLRPMNREVNGMIMRKPHSDIGYYDLSERGHREYMRQLADHFGIYGFCFYHYWFYDHAIMDKAMQRMLGKEHFEYPAYENNNNNSRNRSLSLMQNAMQKLVSEPNKPFFLCWANEGWSKRWDGSENEVILAQKYDGEEQSNAHFMYMLEFFRHENYIRINNRPVFAIYRIERKDLEEINKIFSQWQTLAKEHGFPEGILFLRFLGPFDNTVKSDHIEGFVQFEPGHSWVPKGGGPSIFKDDTFDDEMYLFNNPDVRRAKVNPLAHFKGETPEIQKFRSSQFKVYDVEKTWHKIQTRKFDSDHSQVFYGTFFSWNNAPRRNFTNKQYWNYPHMFDKVDVTAFQAHLQYMKEKLLNRSLEATVTRYSANSPAKIQNFPNFFFLTAWNEWNEQSLFEPNDIDGYDALMAVKQTFKKPVLAIPHNSHNNNNNNVHAHNSHHTQHNSYINNNHPNILTVVHVSHRGGGTEKHVQDLIYLFPEYRHIYIPSHELEATLKKNKYVVLIHIHSAMVGEHALKWKLLGVLGRYCGAHRPSIQIAPAFHHHHYVNMDNMNINIHSHTNANNKTQYNNNVRGVETIVSRSVPMQCFLTVHDYQWLYPKNFNPFLNYLSSVKPVKSDIANMRQLLAYMDRVIYPSRFLRFYYLHTLYPELFNLNNYNKNNNNNINNNKIVTPAEIVRHASQQMQNSVALWRDPIETHSSLPVSQQQKNSALRHTATQSAAGRGNVDHVSRHEVVEHCDVLNAHFYLKLPPMTLGVPPRVTSQTKDNNNNTNRNRKWTKNVLNIAFVGNFHQLKGGDNFLWLTKNLRQLTFDKGQVTSDKLEVDDNGQMTLDIVYHIFGPVMSSDTNCVSHTECIGFTRNFLNIQGDNIVHHGEYKETQLEEQLAKYHIHIVTMLGLWPETWSYAFSAILRTGLLMVYLNHGAYVDRIPRFLQHVPEQNEMPSNSISTTTSVVTREEALKFAGMHLEDYETLFVQGHLRKYFPVAMNSDGVTFEHDDLIESIRQAAVYAAQHANATLGFRPQSVSVQPNKWYLLNYPYE